MREHFFTAPINDLAKAVQILEIRHVTDCLKPVTLVIVLNERKARLSGHRVFAEIFALLDIHHVKVGVCPGTESKLNISFVAKHKLRLDNLGREQVTLPVILCLAFKRHKIILPKLR